MEERMCQQRKSFSKHTQTKYLYQQNQQPIAACHQCKMCSSFSTSSSSSSTSSIASSFSSLSSSSTKDNLCSRQESFDKKNNNCCFIQLHLQSMFVLLRREETLKMAVRLESAHPSRTRYLVVVSRIGKNQTEECCLLGIDCNKCTTVGLVLKVLADTAIRLNGDGGFCVSVCRRQHIFKPVSVQAMWSALQTLYKVSLKAHDCNYFEGGNTHEWVSYYEQRIESDRSCLNEWHAMNDIESRRPPSPDSLRSKPRERLETEHIIRSTLKEIMMSVDLDEVTSKYIRSRLEEQLDVDLREFKSFIDQEMLVILGQMDAATEIFPHIYLGSEWNASNLEELNKNGICYILNVTREIDNFFPGTFDYLNVRVYDDDNTNLLKHWDNTYKYINKVKKENSKVLVHCKMGISRSASVVIAYAMKACNWDFKKAFEYVRKKRTCIKPNQNFIIQLETYQGMLDAMKNKEKLQRSKSETNLKTSSNTAHYRHSFKKNKLKANELRDSQTRVNEKASKSENEYPMLRVNSGVELAQLSLRPKSWSPDNLIASEIFSSTGTMSQSLEQLNVCKLSVDSHSSSASSLSTSPPRIPPAPPLPPLDSWYNLNVRMPCGNGLTYSVSQNKIVQLYSAQNQAKNTSTDDENEEPDSGQRVNHLSESTTAYALQLPSYFQGNVCTSFSKESTNLVIKNSNSSRSSGSGDGKAKQEKSHSSNTIHVTKKERESVRSIQRFVETRRNEKVIGESVDTILRSTSSSSSFSSYQVVEQQPNAVTAGGRWPLDELKPRVPVVEASKIRCAADEPQVVGFSSQHSTFNHNDHLSTGASSYMSSATKTTATGPAAISTTSSNVDYVVARNAAPVATAAANSSSVISTVQLLERLTHPKSGRPNSQPFSAGEKEDDTNKGLVKNLKKEFEAKCHVADADKQRKRCSFQDDTNNNNANNSNSSSRNNSSNSSGSSSRSSSGSNNNVNINNSNDDVAGNVAAASPVRTCSSREDLSVRKLVCKYDKSKCGHAKERSKYEKKQQPPIPPRKSSLEFNKLASKHSTSTVLGSRKGVGPYVKSLLKPSEIRTSVNKAASMFQPFCKQKNSPSSVYNTV